MKRTLLLLALSAAAWGDPGGYRFKLDGRELEPYSFECLQPGAPQKGDVARIDRDLWAVLDEPGEYDLRRDGNRIYRRMPDGSRRVFAASVDYDYQKKKAVDGLQGLTQVEASQLRAVHVKDWSAGVADELAQLKPYGACWSINGLAGFKAGKVPRLPQGLRYLVIQEHHSPCFEDLSSLGDFNSLVYFRGSWMTPEKVSGRLFAAHRGLRYLSSNHLVDAAALVGLTELTSLKASGGEVPQLGFVKSLTSLSRLEMPHCQVKDTAGLSGHPTLSRVELSYNPIDNLPDPAAPALKEFKVLGSKLNAEQVVAFRAAYPGTRLLWSHQETLQESLATCDRLRVRSGGTCHRDASTEKTLIQVDQPAEVRRVVALLTVQEPASSFECMCCGEPSLEFYQGDKLMHTVGFHHGHLLRWEGWGSDCKLAPNGATQLVGWMAQRGLSGPQREHEASQAREALHKRILERATAGFPEALTRALTGSGDFEAELGTAFPEEGRQARALIQILGAADAGWESLEGIAEMLGRLPSSVVGRQIEEALSGSNPVHRRGAARAWRTLALTGWKPADPAVSCEAAVTVLEQSCNAQVREQALVAVKSWRSHLTAAQVESHLRLALTDPEDDVRQASLELIGAWRVAALYDQCLPFLSPKAPPTRTMEQDEDNRVVYHTPPLEDWEVAALTLAQAAYPPALPLIVKRRATPARELALALYGQAQRLQKKHFQGESAPLAVQAVIRDRGRHGLGWAIQSKQSSAQLLEMLRQTRAPGIESVRSPAQLPGWYRKNYR